MQKSQNQHFKSFSMSFNQNDNMHRNGLQQPSNFMATQKLMTHHNQPSFQPAQPKPYFSQEQFYTSTSMLDFS